MKEQFVTYEIAVKLKELGFDDECLAYYDNESKVLIKGHIKNKDMATIYNAILAPLWQQIIDWLREKHNIQFTVESSTTNLKGEWKDWIYRFGNTSVDRRDGFDTYEEAREKGIIHVLKLI